VHHRRRGGSARTAYQDNVPHADVAGVQRAGHDQAADRCRLGHAPAADHERAIPEEPWQGQQRQAQDDRHEHSGKQARRGATPTTATIPTSTPTTGPQRLRGSGPRSTSKDHGLVVRGLLGVEGERRSRRRAREGVAGGQRQRHLEAQRLSAADRKCPVASLRAAGDVADQLPALESRSPVYCEVPVAANPAFVQVVTPVLMVRTS